MAAVAKKTKRSYDKKRQAFIIRLSGISRIARQQIAFLNRSAKASGLNRNEYILNKLFEQNGFRPKTGKK